MSDRTPIVMNFFNQSRLTPEKFFMYLLDLDDWDKAKTVMLPYLIKYLQSINFFKHPELYNTELRPKIHIQYLNRTIEYVKLRDDFYINSVCCNILAKLFEDLDRHTRCDTVIELLTHPNYTLLERYFYYRTFYKMDKVPTSLGFKEKFEYTKSEYEKLQLPKVHTELDRLDSVYEILNDENQFSIYQFMRLDRAKVKQLMIDNGLGVLVDELQL